nr:hypothetical protein [uncultured Flavobacterium sp.]
MFNEMVVKELEDQIPFKFHLDIDLNRNVPLRQKHITSTIKEIVEVCINEFIGLRPRESKHITQIDVEWDEMSHQVQQLLLEDGYRKLPKCIARIRMTRYDFLTKSRHPESQGGTVPNFTDELLASILLKKNKALINYKGCDEQWLVIVEGMGFYSYVDKVKIEKKHTTTFDKVFIYRWWDRELIVVK